MSKTSCRTSIALALSAILALGGSALAADPSSSKAKSYIKNVDRKFRDIDKQIDRDSPNTKSIARYIEQAEKQFGKIAEKDPSWDLSEAKQKVAAYKEKLAELEAADEADRIDSAIPDIDFTVTPAPGVETVTPHAPRWCKGYSAGEVRRRSSNDYEQLLYPSSVEQLAEIPALTCTAPDLDKIQRWSAAYAQSFMNLTGMTLAETEAIITEAVALTSGGDDADARGSKRSRMGRAAARGSRGDSAAELDPMAKALDGVMEIARGDRGNFYGTQSTYVPDFFWWYDQRPDPKSELHRVVWITNYIGSFYPDGQINPMTGWNMETSVEKILGGWTLAAWDLARLDKAAFDRDLAAAGLDGEQALHARVLFARAQQAKRHVEAALEQWVGERPEVKPVIEAVRQAGADWAASYDAHKAGFEAAWAIEDRWLRGRKSAFDGCEAEMQPHVAAVFAASGAKDKAAFEDVIRGPVGYPLVSAYLVCTAHQDRPYVTLPLYKALEGSRVYRGPRAAARWAAMDAVTKAQEDDARYPLEPKAAGGYVDTPNTGWLYKAYETTFNTSVNSEAGVIKSAKPKGEQVHVVYKSKKYKEPIYSCKETSKIDRIEADGTIRYRSICHKTGKTRTIDTTPAPVSVAKAHAAGLKPGRFVRVQRLGYSNKEAVGFPTAIYASSDEKRLLAYFGVQL